MAKATRVHSTQRRTASLRKTSPAARAARPREDDPIFAAIENHLKLENAWCDLEEAREETQAKAQEKHGRRPSPVVSWRNYVCGSDHIESIREALLRSPGIDPITIETEYWDVQARLLGTELAAKEWDERTGLAAVRRDIDRARTAWWQAALQMAKTKPRTPAGAGALLTEILKDLQMDWCETALATVVKGLAAMEAAAPRSQIKKAA